MSKKIILQKATRIEGNADIHIEVEDGRIKAARLLVEGFRGFEKFSQGKRVEFIPHLISRICGLCSAAHQVASLKAIEDALGVEVPNSVSCLREITVLGERISSHALSYFFPVESLNLWTLSLRSQGRLSRCVGPASVSCNF
jgi:sulfhydrogenase subunit alpha